MSEGCVASPDSLPPEVLEMVMKHLSFAEVFNLSLVNWRLARQILTLKSKDDYLGKIFQELNEKQEFKIWENEEFNGMLKIHSEVKSLKLRSGEDILIAYLSQHCPNLEMLDIWTFGKAIILKDGFVNLTVLKIYITVVQNNGLHFYRLIGIITVVKPI